MKFEVTILGSSSATPIFQRHPTSQLVNIHEVFIMIDCGEATQMQLLKYGLKASRIQYILISHLHGDHYLGLVGLLSSLNLNGRKEELTVFGPPGLDELIQLSFTLSQTQLNYPFHFIETKMEEAIILDAKSFFVETIPLHHSIPCTGFKITEKRRALRLLKHKIEEFQIPPEQFSDIKDGKDFFPVDGTLPVSNSELTQKPGEPKSYAFFSDTAYIPERIPNIESVSTLYHEATFLSDMEERATITCHSTAAQAAMMARDAKADRLLLGHFSARYRDLSPILDEAKEIFPSSKLALEGITFAV